MQCQDKVGHYKFVAEPFHCDFSGHLFMGVLGNHLLNCAGFHATERGFGMATLNESNYTWVLSRLVLEMTEMPAEYSDFSVDTWVENVYRLFTDRNFEVKDAQGRTLGFARSVWAMINIDTRKPADLLELHGGHIVDYIISDKPCPIDKPGRIKVSTPVPTRTLDIYYSDIDINGHVNSIKYIEHVLDLFPKTRFEQQDIARFEVAYVAESYFGDKLSLFCDNLDADDYCVEIRKNIGGENPEGEVVCRCRIKFRNKKQEHVCTIE